MRISSTAPIVQSRALAAAIAQKMSSQRSVSGDARLLVSGICRVYDEHRVELVPHWLRLNVSHAGQQQRNEQFAVI